MVTFLLIGAVTIMVFLCFIGPEGFARQSIAGESRFRRRLWIGFCTPVRQRTLAQPFAGIACRSERRYRSFPECDNGQAFGQPCGWHRLLLGILGCVADARGPKRSRIRNTETTKPVKSLR